MGIKSPLSMDSLVKETPKPSLPRYLREEGEGGYPYDIEDYLNGCDPDCHNLTESEFLGDVGDKG